MIPFQDTVGFYYSDGTLALFDGVEHGCKLERNIICAAATGTGPDAPEGQYLVYAVRKRGLLGSKYEFWCADIKRSGSGVGGGIKVERTSKLLELPGKLKSPPSLGFSWVQSAPEKQRVFCVLIALSDGAIWCVEMPWVKHRWLD